MLSEIDYTSIKWIPRTAQFANCLTKSSANSLNLTRVFENGH